MGVGRTDGIGLLGYWPDFTFAKSAADATCGLIPAGTSTESVNILGATCRTETCTDGPSIARIFATCSSVRLRTPTESCTPRPR